MLACSIYSALLSSWECFHLQENRVELARQEHDFTRPEIESLLPEDKTRFPLVMLATDVHLNSFWCKELKKKCPKPFIKYTNLIERLSNVAPYTACHCCLAAAYGWYSHQDAWAMQRLVDNKCTDETERCCHVCAGSGEMTAKAAQAKWMQPMSRGWPWIRWSMLACLCFLQTQGFLCQRPIREKPGGAISQVIRSGAFCYIFYTPFGRSNQKPNKCK